MFLCLITFSAVGNTWEQTKPQKWCPQDPAFSHRQTFLLSVPLLPTKVYLFTSLETALCYPWGTAFYQTTNRYNKMWELNTAQLWSWQSRKPRASGTLLPEWKEMELGIRIGWAFPSPLKPSFQSSVRGSWATPTVLCSKNGYLSWFELIWTVK